MPKKLPRPFVKPAIELSSGAAGRTWQTVPNHKIAVDDIVPDYGKVTGTKDMDRSVMVLSFLSGAVVHVEKHAESFVFTNG